MLKKAGIIVAASAAGILAFSPLAFAGSKDDNGGSHHKDDKGHSKTVKKDDDGGNGGDGDGDTKKDNLENECEFGNEGADVTQGQFGGSSLLGVADIITGAATNLTSQVDTLNCTNVNVTDVVDLDSNNEESTTERNFVEGSFNNEG